MRIAIVHEIVQEFTPPARALIEILRLRPKEFESQHIASWNVDVDTDCRIREGRDAFGNCTQTIDGEGTIARLVIVARGEVDTFDTAGLLRGGEAERFPVEMFLRDSDLTAADTAIRDFAAKTVKPAKTILDRPHFLMRALSEGVEFSTEAEPAAAAAVFKRKKGSAQDLAHVFIAAARAVGIPARCVSGYLAPEKPGETARPHAWAEAFVEGLGWIGFDPSICLCMHDGHVRVASALDYLACAPLRLPPMAFGSRTESLSVKPEQSMGQRQA
ncbi:MAG: transglutaminase family protein [Beijerinckiaceae bacterium]